MAWLRNLGLVVVAGVACKREPSKLDSVMIQPVQTRIALDGEWDEPAWNARSQRGTFVSEAGGEARPYSEIRLLRDETHLFVGFYAADEDIKSDDAFDLTAGSFTMHVTADGRVTPATVRAAVDRDGTIDDPHDDDEEWVIESAVPLAALGPSPVTIHASRCDVTKDGVKHCGSWQGAVDLDKLGRF
ncbi:MAG: hypothetical protein JWO36_5560 [Myxococcales bacterium]|nr:hypothetical protein [Myxococcales bacterium]